MLSRPATDDPRGRFTPMTTLTLTAALVLGLASSLHCVAMCGGIIGALSLGAAPADGTGRFVYVAGYNLGRIGSYAVAGALSGSVVSLLITPDAGARAYRWLPVLSDRKSVVEGRRVSAGGRECR